ncbi:MAG: PfkB family carbohydrate kinase [Gammaproteobacteria bacterium]|nr:PfkB family carbohydrate kinase [Gammaproteobacteria bacterium]MDH5734620.1 PfkB family carbohydrate kinase [Gammaproteobacteria bacterium]
MSHILLTGIVVLDIINTVSSYPEEDSETRALSQEIRRGGNASNTATVLSQLGHDCVIASTLSNDQSGQFLLKDLHQNRIQIDTSFCLNRYTTPVSYITLNNNNGSRTIIHYRNLPELTFNQFDSINLEKYNWLHFEGRNVDQVHEMMKKAKSYNKTISLEVEKERDNINILLPLADIIFFSRPFARLHGFKNAQQCLKYFNSIYPDKLLICTWGTDGAFAMQDNNEYSSHAFYVQKSVDTIGAGDTFIAAFIHAHLINSTTSDSLIYACRLAGLKCSQNGFNNLENINV